MQTHTRAKCTLEGVTNVSVPETAGVYRSMKVSNQFDLAAFQKGVKIKITDQPNENHVAFDLKGIDPPVANALRRILLAEVPTVAVEQVNLWQNTGVLHDEVLVHRLCLIPLNVDAEELEWRKSDEEMSDKNSVLFKLHVKCEQGTKSVYASDFQWTQIDGSTRKFKKVPAPVHGDILITKLRPGQEIECEMYAIKGVGKDHAKWSPVSTAWYRMCPEIILNEEFTGKAAEELVKVCPTGVFDIEDDAAYVANPRNCTTCRACLEKYGEDKIEVNKIKNHFLFNIESVGSLPAGTLFQRAIHILQQKVTTALEILRTTK